MIHNTEMTADILKEKSPGIYSNKIGKVRIHVILKSARVTIFAVEKQ